MCFVWQIIYFVAFKLVQMSFLDGQFNSINKCIAVVCWDGRKPSDDLPNQEKNQYWTVYISGKLGLYLQKERIKKLSDLLEEDKLKLAEIGMNANN